MRSKDDLKKHYESDWNMPPQQSSDFMNNCIREYAVRFFDIDVAVGLGDVSPIEFNGYESGACVFLSRQSKGKFPDKVKNFRVLAMKVYADLKLDQQPRPQQQESYKGFVDGFCDMAEKFM